MAELERVRKGGEERGRERQIVEVLRVCVGGVKPVHAGVGGSGSGSGSGVVGGSGVATVHVDDIDPIMLAKLDADRTALREALTKVPRLSAKLAAECVKQAGRESDLFVTELTDLLRGGDTDQTCCNVAEMLGMRGAVKGCWRALLLHMMKVRPRGMLERRAGNRNVSGVAWGNWLKSLRRVFGERELEESLEGLGFTEAAIRSWTARKLGVGRMDSTSTTSSTGSYR
ncbi:hypothetical protein B0T14DRAFT_525509 [Immersiella caudata]|uniref:Uncharacterized protein n=1 Tax=Immersiella caudata TaxID=314043 RepID=A0AA39WLG1_9PEZI|nr:hypothetical protein B0T14DRAFT_525509 [Immersiella caudata]